jgi:BolA protein
MRLPGTTRKERIETLLRAAFSPERLVVTDDSAAHAGHAGSRPEGETHYTVEIASAGLAALPRLARHRAVNAALAHEFASGLHALAIRA